MSDEALRSGSRLSKILLAVDVLGLLCSLLIGLWWLGADSANPIGIRLAWTVQPLAMLGLVCFGERARQRGNDRVALLLLSIAAIASLILFCAILGAQI